jgi:hypothetical protein
MPSSKKHLVSTKRPKPKVGDLIKVEWADSCLVHEGWIHNTEIIKPYVHRCVSIGMLYDQNKDALTVVANIGGIDNPQDAQISSVTIIPRKCVISMQILKPA